MIWKGHLVGLVSVLFCTLIFGGCKSTGDSAGNIVGKKQSGPRVKEVARTPAEKRKAELLKKIDQRFQNPDAHFELGQMYHADGLWTQAEYEYNTALTFDPVHREAEAALVKLMLDCNDIPKSKLLADIYMNQAAASADGSLKLALAFQGQRLDDYALECYRQALNLAPTSARINRQIGYYYLAKNNKLLAKEYLMRSFQLDHNQPEVAGELGRLGVAVRIPKNTPTVTQKLSNLINKKSN